MCYWKLAEKVMIHLCTSETKNSLYLGIFFISLELNLIIDVRCVCFVLLGMFMVDNDRNMLDSSSTNLRWVLGSLGDFGGKTSCSILVRSCWFSWQNSSTLNVKTSRKMMELRKVVSLDVSKLWNLVSLKKDVYNSRNYHFSE